MAPVFKILDDLKKKQDETSKRVEASLRMLNELASAKAADMVVKTDKRMAQAKELREIPPGLKLYDDTRTVVVSSSVPTNGITGAVDDLLRDPEQNWREVVSKLVKTAVDVLLGSAEGACSERTAYLIALDGHAARDGNESTFTPVRIDYCCWIYDLKSSGLVEDAQHAVAYHIRKSLLDYSNVPGRVQIEYSLRDIGVPKGERDECIAMIEEERKERAPSNLTAYAAAARSHRLQSEEYENLDRALEYYQVPTHA